jgi:hypothetical protein
MFSADVGWSPMLDEVSEENRKKMMQPNKPPPADKSKPLRDKRRSRGADTESIRSSTSARTRFFKWSKHKNAVADVDTAQSLDTGSNLPGLARPHLIPASRDVEIVEEQIAELPEGRPSPRVDSARFGIQEQTDILKPSGAIGRKPVASLARPLGTVDDGNRSLANDEFSSRISPLNYGVEEKIYGRSHGHVVPSFVPFHGGDRLAHAHGGR